MECPECKTENNEVNNYCYDCSYCFKEVELIKKGEKIETGEKKYSTPKGEILIRIQEDRVFMNTDSSYIGITEDKLRLCLMDYTKKAKKKYDWIAPLGILITIATTMTTTTFNHKVLSPHTWQALFIFVALASFVWLIIALRHIFLRISDDEIIRDIKGQKTNVIKQ